MFEQPYLILYLLCVFQNRLLLPTLPKPLESMNYNDLRDLAVTVVRNEHGGFKRRLGWGKPESRPVWWPSHVPWTTRGVQSGVTTGQMRDAIRACYVHHKQALGVSESAPGVGVIPTATPPVAQAMSTPLPPLPNPLPPVSPDSPMSNPLPPLSPMHSPLHLTPSPMHSPLHLTPSPPHSTTHALSLSRPPSTGNFRLRTSIFDSSLEQSDYQPPPLDSSILGLVGPGSSGPAATPAPALTPAPPPAPPRAPTPASVTPPRSRRSKTKTRKAHKRKSHIPIPVPKKRRRQAPDRYTSQ